MPRGAHHAAFEAVRCSLSGRAGRDGEKTLFAELHAGDTLRAPASVKVMQLIRERPTM